MANTMKPVANDSLEEDSASQSIRRLQKLDQVEKVDLISLHMRKICLRQANSNSYLFQNGPDFWLCCHSHSKANLIIILIVDEKEKVRQSCVAWLLVWVRKDCDQGGGNHSWWCNQLQGGDALSDESLSLAGSSLAGSVRLLAGDTVQNQMIEGCFAVKEFFRPVQEILDFPILPTRS
jgi:hypothetical protein